MIRWIKATRSLYIIPHKCDVCGAVFDVGYAVRSDSGVRGDVCGPCVGKKEPTE